MIRAGRMARIGTGLLLAAILYGCGGKMDLELRTDAGPLARRLRLPQSIRAVRWVAVSPVHDTGWIPPRTEFYEVYAYLDLDESGWAELEKSLGPPGTRGQVVIPEEAAALIIPHEALDRFARTSGGWRAEGPAFPVTSLSVDPKTTAEDAIRVDGALVVRMKVR